MSAAKSAGGRWSAWLWSDASRSARLARVALLPLAWLFAMAARLRVAAYRRGILGSERADAPVISVGNLVVGGTGKTPFVIWLVDHLERQGLRTVVVSRGYGGRAGRPVLIDFDSSSILPEDLASQVFRPRTVAEAIEGAGDEATLVALRNSVPVVAFPDRREACRVACEAYEPDCIVLDDGFQHLRLARELDLVLLGGREERASTLPAGPLREPRSALARADVLIHHESSEARPRLRRVPVGLVASARRGPAVREVGDLAGKKVAAVAAIADPRGFLHMLEAAGAVVARVLTYADHHAYELEDFVDIERSALEVGAEMLVTTEKDLVKLERFGAGRIPVVALRIEIEIDGAEEILSRISRLDAKRGRQHDPRSTREP